MSKLYSAVFFFFKQKTAYENEYGLVGSEMCIRDRGQEWGGYDVVAWFRTRADVPEEGLGQKLALRFLVGPRDGGGSTAVSLLYVNGRPLQGIDVWHEEAVLPPELARERELL